MDGPGSLWLSFRLDPADDEGTETLTFVLGGSHRGGCAEGRLSWTGGANVGLWEAIAQRVKLWVDQALYEQRQLTFMDRMDAGDPPLV